MITKTDCINRANKARHGAKVANTTAALYAVTFGGNDSMTQKAFQDADVAIEVAKKWEQLAALHPATRAKLFRSNTLPSYLFTPY